MTQPTTPTLTPVVGVPATITRRDQLTGTAVYDPPYLGGPVGAGVGVVPFTWDPVQGRWEDAAGNPLKLPLARKLDGVPAPRGWLYLNLTWIDERGERQEEQLRFRPEVGDAAALDLTVEQSPQAYMPTKTLTDLTAAAQEAADRANRAAQQAGAVPANIAAKLVQVDQALADSAQSTAKADAAILTLSKASSYGLLRATKADLVTAFAAAPVGATGTDNDTGDVYLKVQGAPDWGQPITNLSSETVSVKRFGARASNTPEANSTALDVAAAYSAVTGAMLLIAETLPIARTWVLPNSAQVDSTFRGWLKPMGDFVAFRAFTREQTYVGIKVTTAHLATYSSDHIQFSGGTAASRAGTLHVDHAYVQAHSAQTDSRGVVFQSDGYQISFARVKTVLVNYTRDGLVLENNLANTVGSGQGASWVWVNGNTFGQVIINSPKRYAIELNDPFGGEVSGNTFESIQIQCNAAGTKRGVYAHGKKILGNVFTCKAWDWGYGIPDPDGRRIAHEITADNPLLTPSSGNIIRDGSVTSDNVKVGAYDRFENSTFWPVPHALGFVAPGSRDSRSFAGNASDALTHADKRFTVTTTSGAATANGYAMANVFRVRAESRAYWAPNTFTGTAVWEIDFGASKQYIDLIGIQFDFLMYCKGVKVEWQRNSTGVWATLMDRLDNTGPLVVWQSPGWNGAISDVRRLRVTVSDPLDPTRGVSVARIFASSSDLGQGAFLELMGGTLYGDLVVKGNIYGGAGGTNKAVLEGAASIGLVSRQLPAVGGADTWFKLARPQVRNPVDGSEAAAFLGTLYAQPAYGSSANKAAIAHFQFGVRQGSTVASGASMKPLVSLFGEGAVEFRVYRTSDGWHDVYVRLAAYTRPTLVTYTLIDAAEVAGAFTAVDPTADSSLTLVWSSATDAGQGISLNGPIRVQGAQVVGARQAAVANSTGTQADDTRAINALLAACRAHGLIAP